MSARIRKFITPNTKAGLMLKGIIERASMTGVLCLLDDVGATGNLILESSDRRWVFSFWQGRVTDVASPQAASPEVTPGIPAREHIVSSIAEVLELSEGSFSWSTERITAPPTMAVYEVDDLLPAARDRIRELQGPRRAIPSLECVAYIVADQEEGSKLQVTAEQWRVLAFADGRRSVGELSAETGCDELETLRRLKELIDAGLLAVSRVEVDRGTPEAGAEEAPAPHPLFEIVTVCTGNRFRSPLAEAFIREQVAGLPVRVRSLGLQDLGQAPALPEALALAEELGVDLSQHRARCLEGADLSGVDLVVAFERSHLARAVVDARAPFRSTYLLVELVDLLEGIEDLAESASPIERARRALAFAQEKRAPTSMPSARGELLDPLGGPASGYRDAAERLQDLSRRLVGALFGRVVSEVAPD